MSATRRGLLAGASLAAILPPALPSSLADADMRAAATDFHALQAESELLDPILQGEDQAAAEAAYNHCDKVIWERQDQIVDALIDVPATSMEGITAKAGVLEVWLRRRAVDFRADTFEDVADDHEKLAMSLVKDVQRLREAR